MKIAIIGGGALGLLFSYYLNQVHEVTLYTRTNEQAECINREGICLIEGEVFHRQLIQAKHIDSWNDTYDLIFVTVKGYHLSLLMPLVSQWPIKQGGMVFLQNGMGHVNWLAKLTAETIYLGSVEHGASRLNPTTVSHNGQGLTRLAAYRGTDDLLMELKGTAPKGFPFVNEPDYKMMLMKKLLVNAVINPLTAAFNVPNGMILANPFYHKIALHLFEEATTVLEIHNKHEHWQNVQAVCRQTATNRSSMLKDIESGRETEIDAILGYLVEEAARKQMAIPLITNYYNHIKGKEILMGDAK
jgi:2-dehydropantoate 2-reductase